MKKQKLLAMTVFAIVGMAFLSANHTYAAEKSVRVGEENIYVASGTKSNEAGTATYNSANSTLTLNNYDGEYIHINLDDPEAETKIVLKGDNTITTASSYQFSGIDVYNGIVLTGDGKLVINTEQNHRPCIDIATESTLRIDSGTYELNCNNGIDATSTIIEDGSFTGNNLYSSHFFINGGKFDLSGKIEANEIVIYGGNFNVASIVSDNITINDGDFDIDGYIEAYDSITINGGDITLPESIYAENTITINGGNILIDIQFEEDIVGIYGKSVIINDGQISINISNNFQPEIFVVGIDGERVTINGGQTTINTPLVGIASSMAELNGGIQINGGTTKIVVTGDAPRAVAIRSFGEIVLGPKVYTLEEGISFDQLFPVGPTIQYFYHAATNADGSFAKKLTIQEIPEEPESDIKVPDTGLMSTTGQSFAVVVTTLSIPALLILIYISNTLIRQHKEHIKFD